MKNTINKAGFKYFIYRVVIRIILKFHNLFYGLAGMISQKIEPDGLHPKHRLTDYHKWFIAQIMPEWTILDVGCGNGALTADLSQHCKHVLGIDISSPNINLAKRRGKGEFICGDVTTHLFNRRFDAVVLSNVLEHIEDRVSFLKKLLRYSGIFLVRVPMIDRDWITLYKLELGVESRLDPGHFIEYTLESFTKELNDAGLKIDTYRIRYGELYAVASPLN